MAFEELLLRNHPFEGHRGFAAQTMLTPSFPLKLAQECRQALCERVPVPSILERHKHAAHKTAQHACASFDHI
jgi:hypothetical protein